MNKTFTYAHEKEYYATNFPREVRPHTVYRPYLEAVFRHMEPLRDQKVLELGAGECLHSRLMAERYAPQIVVGMDLFAERMRPMALVWKNRRLKFVGGDCYRLPFENESFGIVYGCGILHHLPDLNKPFQEIRRVLKSGGSYYGMEPNFYCPMTLARQILDPRSKNEYFIKPERVVSTFRQNGFDASLHYFWVRFPKLRSRFLCTCFAVQATKLPARLSG